MLDIDICPDQPAWVYATDSPVSVTRIGDIILLEKDSFEKFQPRSPWEFLFESSEFEAKSGSLANINRSDDYNLLSFYIQKDLNVYNLYNLRHQQISLAIIQGGIQFSCALASECFLCGTKNDGKSWMIDFEAAKSTMIYNK